MSSPFLELSVGRTMIVAYGFVVVAGIIIVIFASSVFIMLPVILTNQSSAFATFPGENGKIAFGSTRDDNEEIYVMNSDGSGQTTLTTTNLANDFDPDWAPATQSREKGTTPPFLSVPQNKVVEAPSSDGAQVRYTVTARDN